MNLFESGGKKILGVNALQTNDRDVVRAIRRYRNHLHLVAGMKHWKVLDQNRNIIQIFPMGSIGPKAAIGTLTKVRNYLESIGQYTRQKGESGGVSDYRQNQQVEKKPQKQTVSPLKRTEEKIKRYVELVRKPTMGAAKRARLSKAIDRLKENIRTNLINKEKKTQ